MLGSRIDQKGVAAIVFLIAAVIVFAVAAGIKYSGQHYQNKPQVDLQSIQSFDDCVKAGFPVLQTYPEQCKTPDGRNFVKPTPIQSFPPNPQPTGVISSPADQVPQPNTTANWQTFNSSKFGFSFKYPEDWTVKDNSNSTSDPTYVINTGGVIDFVDSKDNLKLSLQVVNVSVDYSLRQIMAENGSHFDTLEGDLGGGESYLIEIISEKVQVGGRDSYKVKENLNPTIHKNDPVKISNYYYIPLGSMTIVASNFLLSGDISMIDQVITTFKFNN